MVEGAASGDVEEAAGHVQPVWAEVGENVWRGYLQRKNSVGSGTRAAVLWVKSDDFGQPKKVQDKDRGRRWRLRPVTSARSAGSYGKFPVYQKWGQKHGDGISFGVTFPENLETQRKSRGHAGDTHSFLLLWDYGSSVSSL